MSYSKPTPKPAQSSPEDSPPLDLFRKRLIFIRRRYFDGSKSRQISAVSSNPTESELSKEKPLNWNQSDVTFFKEDYLANVIIPKTQGVPKTPFVSFQVIVPSLLFLGVYKKRGTKVELKNIDNEDIVNTFQDYLPRQLGSHVFVSRFGSIRVVKEYMKGLKERGKLTVSNPSTIHSIYPVIRYNYEPREPPPSQELVFGLYFQFIGNNNDFGERYYHRFGNYALKKGGVEEITENMINELMPKKSKIFEGKELNYSGLFVCAGAKLVVVDNCQERKNAKGHTRSLIQEGGVVFVDNMLRFREHLNISEEEDCFEFKHYFWSDKKDKKNKKDIKGLTHNLQVFGSSTKLEPDVQKQLSSYKNPIIFLGANDSNYNTISWTLDIKIKRTDFINNSYVWNLIPTLEIPEGGHIVAVADGLEGIEEIQQRISYEMLHDSVVTNHGTAFQVISEIILKKILRPQSYNYLYGPDINTPVETKYPSGKRKLLPLFKEFNFMIRTNYRAEYEMQRKNTIDRRDSRLPVPPMYPPFYSDTHKLLFIPSTQFPDPVEKIYPISKFPTIEAKDQTYEFKIVGNNTNGKLINDCNIFDFDWTRLKDADIKEAEVDGVYKRIGVDGWVWKKKDTSYKEPMMFKFNTYLYCPQSESQLLEANAEQYLQSKSQQSSDQSSQSSTPTTHTQTSDVGQQQSQISGGVGNQSESTQSGNPSNQKKKKRRRKNKIIDL